MSQHLVVKGGSAERLVTRREGIKYDTRLPYLAFRCVFPVEGPSNAFEASAATAAASGIPPVSSWAGPSSRSEPPPVPQRRALAGIGSEGRGTVDQATRAG
ncbi:MAG: hypothetical protein WBX00_11310 [Isosphaeraceae bacterium]